MKTNYAFCLSLIHSFHLNNLLVLHKLSQLVNIKISTSDNELANSLSLNRFLSLFFKLKVSAITDNAFDWLAALGFSFLLNWFKVNIFRLSKETHGKVACQEYNTLLKFLELNSKLR